jgi:hypothetical protein
MSLASLYWLTSIGSRNSSSKFPVSLESFQPVPRRYGKVVEDCGCVEHPEFAKRHSLNPRTQFLGGESLKKALGVSVSEALDHAD